MITAIIKKNKKYLLIKRSKKTKMYHNQWQFPEGGVKFGEAPLQALKREVKEETNLELEDAKYSGTVSSVLKEFNIKVWHFVRIVYRCKVKDNIGDRTKQKFNQTQRSQKSKVYPKIKLSKKHIEFGWFTKKQIENLDLVKGFKFENIKKMI